MITTSRADPNMTIQEATIQRLEQCSDPATRFVVEAWPLPEAATQSCAHDSLHGKGTCYGPDGDGLCLACMVDVLDLERWYREPARWVSIDVAA